MCGQVRLWKGIIARPRQHRFKVGVQDQSTLSDFDRA